MSTKIREVQFNRSRYLDDGYRRVALYCRVSTKMDNQLNSLSDQMKFQKEEIVNHPDWSYVATYSDIKSGRNINSRPGFKEMMDACEEGKLNLI